MAVGRLRRPHGLHGEILMEVLTDFPERLVPELEVFLGPDYIPARIRSLRWHNQALLVSFHGYADRETAGELRNQYVTVEAATRPALPEGEYYHHELIGLQCVDEQGLRLGFLREILETGANDVYIIQPDQGKEILIPAIRSVVLEIDLTAGIVRVALPPGLI